MVFRRGLSVFVLLSVFFAYSGFAGTAHVASSQQLQAAIQNSNQQASAERKAVQDFLARPEVQAQMAEMGVKKLNTAALSDSDIQNLNKQIMSLDLQKQPAGLGKAAIALIVIGAVALTIAIVAVEVWAVNNSTYYY